MCKWKTVSPNQSSDEHICLFHLLSSKLISNIAFESIKLEGSQPYIWRSQSFPLLHLARIPRSCIFSLHSPEKYVFWLRTLAHASQGNHNSAFLTSSSASLSFGGLGITLSFLKLSYIVKQFFFFYCVFSISKVLQVSQITYYFQKQSSLYSLSEHNTFLFHFPERKE